MELNKFIDKSYHFLSRFTMSDERIDLNHISNELDKSLKNKSKRKFFKNRDTDANFDSKKLVEGYRNTLINSICNTGKRILNLPTRYFQQNKKPLQNANQPNPTFAQARLKANRNANDLIQPSQLTTLKPAQSIISLVSTSSTENNRSFLRCEKCDCVMNSAENFCRYCDDKPEIQVIESDTEIDLIEQQPTRSNEMSTATANTSMNNSQISVTNFYDKANANASPARKSKNASILLNITSDLSEYKTKYEVDCLFVGTYRFLSRTYFRIDSDQILLNFSSKECLNINYKLIKLLSLCEARKESCKFVFIKIDFVFAGVEAIKAFLESLPGENGVFKYDSINGHEKYYIMKLKHLGQEETSDLKARLKMYLQRNYKDDAEVFKIYEEQRKYYEQRPRMMTVKKQKVSKAKQQEQKKNDEDKDEEMQLDPKDFPSLQHISSRSYSSNVYSKLGSDPQSNYTPPVANKYSLRSTPRAPSAANQFIESEEMEVCDVKPKLPFKEIKNNKIIFETNDSGSLTILKTDLLCLDDGNFLNDKIIEFYLIYIKSRLITDELLRQKVYIFSSFFFTKMLSLTKGSSTEQ